MSAVCPAAAAPHRASATPAVNIAIFALFVAVTLAIVIRASRNNQTAADFYAGGRAFTGRQNGIAISGDYLSAASLPRHRRRHRPQRLRRLPLLDRVPGRLAGRPAAGRRAAPQHRPVHDGRRAVLPAAAAPGPDGGRDLDPRRVSFFYLLAQMAGAGGLVALLLGIAGPRRAERWSSPSSAC